MLLTIDFVMLMHSRIANLLKIHRIDFDNPNVPVIHMSVCPQINAIIFIAPYKKHKYQESKIILVFTPDSGIRLANLLHDIMDYIVFTHIQSD